MIKIYVLIILATLAAAISTEYDQDNSDYYGEDSSMGSDSNELSSAASASTKGTRNTTVANEDNEIEKSAHEKVVIWSKNEHDTEMDSEELTEVVTMSRRNGITTQPATIPTETATSPHNTRASSHKSAHHAHTPGSHPGRSEWDHYDTTPKYPFSVSLQRKGAHYATGALLDKRWILTVAREFFNVRESIKLFRARLGSVNCKKGGTLIPLKRLEIHPSYMYGQPNFDLALLRMAQPVDYTDFIRPIGLSNSKGKVRNAKFMTTYWPKLIVRGHALPVTAKERVKLHNMSVSTQRFIPQEKCVSLNSMQNVTLDDSTLCLKPVASHHSKCLPDAGAPVVAEDGLWGITSGWISESCTTVPSPTVFSRLSSAAVRSWLDKQLLSW